MAKILVVTEGLTATVVKLTAGLKQQQHQVTVITSRDADEALPQGVELLRPFRTWSLTEGLRVLPVIYALQPQIVHLVLDDDHLRPAQVLLSLLAKTLPLTVLTTSILHIRQGLRFHNPVRYLLQESDIVTCPSVETLGALRGLNVRSPRQGRAIIPPVLDFNLKEDLENDATAVTDLLRRLKGQDFLVLPMTEPDFDPRRLYFRRLAILAAHRHVVLIGSFTNWSLRERKRFQTWMHAQGLAQQWTLSGPLGRSDLRRILAQSEVFCLAGQQLTPLEITEYFLHAIQAGATMILDHRQSTIHADLWRNGETCWIVQADDLLNQLQALLRQSPLRRPQTLPDPSILRRDLVDAPLNELNRLYNKALSLKHVL